MTAPKAFALPNPSTPNTPVVFDPDVCNGCNQCVEVCQVDAYIPNPARGTPPIILHPDECWYCGSCVNVCRRPGAVRFNWPLSQRAFWKDPATGRVFRDLR